ncbi:hypothetical protein [Cyclobacterium amurskyense]|uniref:Secreted protein n=1 Tax=Cyclobacterium amurskyense TaxID=320787 RepID=A0A0H4PC45_9BACT|nr:hypothetical protein [Cyclobacterium amurskyense]AKP50705.1 hypothetical protein CA2015_1257 [Cyclobacterium amurskyense]|tara:strand:+ start:8073 stop:8564 length:492 start_codon:yes stop_codon:yes gene_type:complete
MVKKVMFAAMAMILMYSVSNESKAQAYNTAVGLRLGSSSGLSVKHFISQDAAIEGILHTRWRGLLLTGLYEVHKDIEDVSGLGWFYGGGAHLGSWNSGSNNPYWAGNNYKGSTILGIDGIIGLDYVLEDLPLNFSLDFKPAINLINGGGFWGDDFALSVRYIF